MSYIFKVIPAEKQVTIKAAKGLYSWSCKIPASELRLYTKILDFPTFCTMLQDILERGDTSYAKSVQENPTGDLCLLLESRMKYFPDVIELALNSEILDDKEVMKSEIAELKEELRKNRIDLEYMIERKTISKDTYVWAISTYSLNENKELVKIVDEYNRFTADRKGNTVSSACIRNAWDDKATWKKIELLHQAELRRLGIQL